MNKIYFSCPHCSEAISDAKSVCPHCNAAYSDKVSVVKQLSVWNLIGLIMGIIVVFMGIGTVNSGRIIVTTPTASFGGDFYTYIYDAVRDVNFLIKDLSENILFGIGMLILAVGFFMICFFLRHLINKQLIYKNPVNYAEENSMQQNSDTDGSAERTAESDLTVDIIEDK